MAPETCRAFAEQYARAREKGYDAMAEQVIEIADTPVAGERVEVDADGVVTKITRHDMTEHRKMQMDARKWLLSKALPKKYGDMTRFQHTGADGKPIELSMPLETARALLHADE
jgi:hypothetical protein